MDERYKKISAQSKYAIGDIVVFWFSITYGGGNFDVLQSRRGMCFAICEVAKINYNPEKDVFTYELVAPISKYPILDEYGEVVKTYTNPTGVFLGASEDYIYNVWEFLESMSERVLNLKNDNDVK